MKDTSAPSGDPHQKRPDLSGYQIVELENGEGRFLVPHILWEVKNKVSDICHKDDDSGRERHGGLERPMVHMCGSG